MDDAYPIRLSRAFALLLAAAPVLIALWWGFAGSDALRAAHLPDFAAFEATPARRLYGAALTLAWAAPGLWALARLRTLCRLFAQGDAYAAASVAALRGAGRGAALFGVAGIVYAAALPLALTFDNPPGNRVLTVGIDAADALALVAGGVLLLLAGALDGARRLRDENAQFV